MLPEDLKSQLTPREKLIQEKMKNDLSLNIVGFEGLHLPMLSWTEGPGFASLMVLGSMSDRILRTYKDG